MQQYIDYQWIATNQQLAEVCEKASRVSAVMLDTEFVRVRSYYASLGLLQLFDGHQVSLIDPREIDDFSPFVALLANPSVVKVLHACTEDLEVFERYFNQLPMPLMDTQIMANFLNLGVSLGFSKLVAYYLNIELDKGAARTNWLARPLSETQLQYACADVWYLFPVYQQLKEALANSPWESVVVEECDVLLAKRKSVLDPAKVYRQIKYAWRLAPYQLAVLQRLAQWRLEEAKAQDLAINFVVKEESLIQIAKIMPKHTSQLLEFMHPSEVRLYGKKILRLVEQGMAVEPSQYPEKIPYWAENKTYKHALKAMGQKLSKIQPVDLATELLANKRQLTQLFKWYMEGKPEDKRPELLCGWREKYGLQLISVLENVRKK